MIVKSCRYQPFLWSSEVLAKSFAELLLGFAFQIYRNFSEIRRILRNVALWYLLLSKDGSIESCQGFKTLIYKQQRINFLRRESSVLYLNSKKQEKQKNSYQIGQTQNVCENECMKVRQNQCFLRNSMNYSLERKFLLPSVSLKIKASASFQEKFLDWLQQPNLLNTCLMKRQNSSLSILLSLILLKRLYNLPSTRSFVCSSTLNPKLPSFYLFSLLCRVQSTESVLDLLSELQTPILLFTEGNLDCLQAYYIMRLLTSTTKQRLDWSHFA